MATTKKPEETVQNPYRTVKIKLFKDNGKYKEPLFVSVNNYTAQIPRGVEVEVPYFVAELLENVARQDEQTAVMIERVSNEYEQAARAAGVE